jgi:hypothetical protein
LPTERPAESDLRPTLAACADDTLDDDRPGEELMLPALATAPGTEQGGPVTVPAPSSLAPDEDAH